MRKSKKLLALLLTALLVVSMLPATALAAVAETDVAKIGDTGYATFADAVKAANNGDKIEILVDKIELTDVPSAKQNITVSGLTDKDGKPATTVTKWTANSGSKNVGCTFENFIVTEQVYGFAGNNTTIKNCKFTGGNGFITAYANGLVTIEDCDFNTTTYGIHFDGGSGDVLVKNSKVSGFNTFAATLNSLTFDNCEFLGRNKSYSVVQTHGTMEIKNSTFDDAFFNGTCYVGTAKANGYVIMTNVKMAAGNSKTLGDDLIGAEDASYTAMDVTKDASGKYTAGKLIGGKDAATFLPTLLADGYTIEAGENGWYNIVEIPPVAQIGEGQEAQTFITLADAIAAVSDDTLTTITMIEDETIKGNSGVTVAAGQNIVLDLNGHTVKNAVNEDKASQVITNKGTLTITDGSAAGTGLLTNAVMEGAKAGEWWSTPQYNYATNVITNRGTLTVEGGKIYETAAGSICYAVDNNSTDSDAVFNMKGGLVCKDSGTAVRMFCNSTTKANKVNVSGGAIEAGYAAIWVQLPGSSQQKKLAELNVSGGKLTGGYAFYDYSYGDLYDEVNYDLSGGTFDGDIFSYGANFNITGGTYNGEVAIKQDKASDVSVTGGKFANDVYTYGDNASTDFITGGLFSARPDTAYVADEKAVMVNDDPNTKTAYPFKVDTPESGVTVAEVTTGETEAKSDVTEGQTKPGSDEKFTADEATAATAATAAITGNMNVTGKGVDVASTQVAQENTVTGSDTTYQTETGETSDVTLVDAVNATPQVNSATANDIAIVVQTYTEVSVVDVTLKGDDANMIQSITYDIQPMIQKIATTTTIAENAKINPAAIVTEAGDTQNAVKVGEPQKLVVTETTSVTIPLPANFVKSDGTTKYTTGEQIDIKHVKSDNSVYYYKGTITNAGGDYSVSFVNPDGFSTFTLMANASTKVSVTQNGSTVYFETLQNAADYVVDGATVTLTAAGAGDATIARNVSFIFDNGSFTDADIAAGTNYKKAVTINDGDEVTYAFTYVAPSGGGGGGAASYAVSAASATHGKVSVDKKNASSGSTVTITVAPDKGFTLETLTVKDAKGNEVTLTAVKTGETYTFKMPAGKVTISATFMEDNTMLNFFVDVKADDYFYDAVLWAAKNGITSGVDELHFAPMAITTRGQMVTFLWRAAGSPEPTEVTCEFTDVKASEYYYKAVLWAAETGLTKGTSDTTFSPDAEVSRGQTVTFLARLNGVKDDASGYSHNFADVSAADYFNNAVAWAYENKITEGTSATTFSPNDDCLRGQIVTFLYRNFVK